MNKLNLVNALNLGLHQEMEKDDTIVVMGEDVGKEGGVFRVTQGLQKIFGKERVIDTPLAESGIIGTAVGMAAYGLKPICEMQFSGFVYPAFNQILNHVARIRNRSRGRFTCQMVIRMPFSGGIRALEHHSESMEALFTHIPGLKVVIPATPHDAKGLLVAAIRDPDPVIFMEPKRVYRAIKEEVPDEDYLIKLGKAKVVQEGSDITVVTWGAMVRETEKALATIDALVELIDLRTIYPMDEETIIKSVKKTGRMVVVHEAPRTCGVGAEIATLVMEKAFLSLKAPVGRVTGYDVVMPYYQNELNYLPSPERIKSGIEKILKY